MKLKRIDLLVFLFLFIVGIFVFGYDGSVPDYEPYKWMYENSWNYRYTDLVIEPIYIFICRQCYRVGMPYNIFLVAVIITGVIILWHTLSRYADNKYWVLFAYTVFPFYADTIQIRNFMAYAIVLFGCRFLIEDDGIKRIWKFLLCIVAAAGFHLLALVYVLLLATLIDEKMLRSFVWIVGVVFFILFLGTSFFQRMIMSVEKYKGYFQGNNLLSMNAKNMIFTSLFVFMNYFMVKILLRRKSEKTDFDRWFGKVNEIILIYLIMIVFLGNNFYRIFRNLIPLYYIEYSTLNVDWIQYKGLCRNNRVISFLKFNYPVVFEAAFELKELLKK